MTKANTKKRPVHKWHAPKGSALRNAVEMAFQAHREVKAVRPENRAAAKEALGLIDKTVFVLRKEFDTVGDTDNAHELAALAYDALNLIQAAK